MADNSEQRAKELQDEQLKGVNAAYDVATDEVVLARVLGISDEVRKRIEAVLGVNHADLFREARAVSEAELLREGVANAKDISVRRAFWQVYGGFALGAETVDTQVQDSLNKALKYGIDEFGIAARPELQAALARLEFLVPIETDRRDLIADIFGAAGTINVQEQNVKKKGAEKKIAEINEVLNTLGDDSLTGDYARLSALLSGVTPPTGLQMNFSRPKPSPADYAPMKDAKSDVVKVMEMILNSPLAGAITSVISGGAATTPVSTPAAPPAPAAPGSASSTYPIIFNYNATPIDTILSSLRTLAQQTYSESATPTYKAAIDSLKQQAQAALNDLEPIKAQMDKAYNATVEFVKKVKSLVSAGAAYPGSYSEGDFRNLEKALGGLNPDVRPNLKAFIDFKSVHDSQLAALSGLTANDAAVEKIKTNLAAQLTTQEKIKDDAEDNIKKAAKEKAKIKDISDVRAAKLILISALKDKNVASMDHAEADKIATLWLTSDVMRLQTEKNRDAIAANVNENAAAVLAQEARKQILDMVFKEGDKEVKLFEGLELDDIENWTKLEAHLDNGRISLNNAFYLLAGLRTLHTDANSALEVRRLEKKVKTLLAKELGVDKKMTEAGAVSVVNEAFDDTLSAAMRNFDIYQKNEVKNSATWERYGVQAAKLKYKDLTERLRRDEMRRDEYEMQVTDLIEEVRENGMDPDDLGISENAALTSYWYHPKSQWVRDRMRDMGMWGLKKSVAFAKATAGNMLHGTFAGAGMLLSDAARLTVNTAFAAVRYPYNILKKGTFGFLNLFRRNKLETPDIIADVKNDVSALWNRGADRVVGMATGAWEKGTERYKADMTAEWTQYKTTAHADWSWWNPEAGKKAAESFAEKAKRVPVGVDSVNVVSLDKYKQKLAAVSGFATAAPAETNKAA